MAGCTAARRRMRIRTGAAATPVYKPGRKACCAHPWDETRRARTVGARAPPPWWWSARTTHGHRGRGPVAHARRRHAISRASRATCLAICDTWRLASRASATTRKAAVMSAWGAIWSPQTYAAGYHAIDRSLAVHENGRPSGSGQERVARVDWATTAATPTPGGSDGNSQPAPASARLAAPAAAAGSSAPLLLP